MCSGTVLPASKEAALQPDSCQSCEGEGAPLDPRGIACMPVSSTMGSKAMYGVRTCR